MLVTIVDIPETRLLYAHDSEYGLYIVYIIVIVRRSLRLYHMLQKCETIWKFNKVLDDNSIILTFGVSIISLNVVYYLQFCFIRGRVWRLSVFNEQTEIR